MFLNKGIVDNERPDGKCLLIFVTDYFLGLFSHPPLFSNIRNN